MEENTFLEIWQMCSFHDLHNMLLEYELQEPRNLGQSNQNTQNSVYEVHIVTNRLNELMQINEYINFLNHIHASLLLNQILFIPLMTLILILENMGKDLLELTI